MLVHLQLCSLSADAFADKLDTAPRENGRGQEWKKLKKKDLDEK